MVVACIISSSSSLLLLLLKMENEGGPHVSLNWVSSNNPTVECMCKEETRMYAYWLRTQQQQMFVASFEALNKRDRSWCLPPAPPLGEEEETQGGSRAARLPCHAMPTYRKEHGIWVGGSPCHVMSLIHRGRRACSSCVSWAFVCGDSVYCHHGDHPAGHFHLVACLPAPAPISKGDS